MVPHNVLSSPKYNGGPSSLRNTGQEKMKSGELILSVPSPRSLKTFTEESIFTWNERTKYKGTLLSGGTVCWKDVATGITTSSWSLLSGSQISCPDVLGSICKVQIPVPHTSRVRVWSSVEDSGHQSNPHRSFWKVVRKTALQQHSQLTSSSPSLKGLGKVFTRFRYHFPVLPNPVHPGCDCSSRKMERGVRGRRGHLCRTESRGKQGLADLSTET